ncbi:nuclease-related domain-containing protein [Arsukibacterium sp.]|uniref:nuclease-related domain-containing protein n=1 Tax=Arsukibacterium sp. TaxID=1977258 RepID=UPI002FDB6BB9
MRCLLLIISLFLLSLPLAYGQQQYTEGACILLHQQMQRFSHIPQSSSYRNAQREYDRFCRKPAPATPAEPQPKPVVQPPPAVVPEANVQPEPKPEPLPPQNNVPEVESTDEPVSADIAPEPEKELTQPTAEVATTSQEPNINDSATTIPASEVVTPEPLMLKVLNNLPLVVANIFALLLAIFLLTTWLGWNLPGFKGVFAEYKLNRLLRWRFARGYHHFRKLKMLTAKDELVMIDHLVLSPFGIFVIMVKDYRGHIFGSETEANWMRLYLGTTKQFMNPLHENFKHVEAVKNLLQLHGSDALQHVHSVIAFSRVAQFKTEMPANVAYIDQVSAYLKQFSEPCFGDEQLGRFSALLSRASTDI